MIATTSSSPFRGAPGAHAGVADPGLSASVLIGGCVAFWRIGLRVSDARCGRCFLPWFPPPRRRFSMRPISLVFLKECIQCRMVIQCRAESADEIRSIVVASRPPAKELETKVQLSWGHAWYLHIADQIWRPGLRVEVGH